MRSYRLISVKNFPILSLNERKNTFFQNALPGQTRDPKTELIYINSDFYGFEHYRFDHEMIINECGLAFGFIDDKAVELNFSDFLKKFTINCYLKRKENYAYLSANSNVVISLLRVIKKNSDLCTEIDDFSLDMHDLSLYVPDFLSIWLSGVSTRVTTSAFFGSDLLNEPLYQKLSEEGAELTSVTIPFHGIRIQISEKAGISSHQVFENINDELQLVQRVKTELIDNIVKSPNEIS